MTKSSSLTLQTAGLFLQNHVNDLRLWYSKLKIKVDNEKLICKSTYLPCYFYAKKRFCPPISRSNQIIHPVFNVRYLGIILVERLTWEENVKQKRQLLNSRRKELYPLLRKSSKLSLKYKLLLYNSFLKPI